MEMKVNWSKPKILLSLRDTQGSPSYSVSAIAQSVNVPFNTHDDCLIYAISLTTYLIEQLISLTVIQ
jgi:hypothetical protein